uniref:Uncharacterized protein n=1 Tax=Anopheles dirus TaxID=7168 RepID=A0A182NWP0_9DIPT
MRLNWNGTVGIIGIRSSNTCS